MRVAEPILRPVTEMRDGALDSSYSLNWFRVYRVSLFMLVATVQSQWCHPQQWTVWGPSVYSVTAFEDRVLLQTEWGFQQVDVHKCVSRKCRTIR